MPSKIRRPRDKLRPRLLFLFFPSDHHKLRRPKSASGPGSGSAFRFYSLAAQFPVVWPSQLRVFCLIASFPHTPYSQHLKLGMSESPLMMSSASSLQPTTSLLSSSPPGFCRNFREVIWAL
ncbi:hypothetical protein TIFTF001_017396 [Ficus carica]|uniref:Uncharacterized protein n=1 Tax=Ficus carica TaxID=3494 RepID=A0AA88A7Z9_FICCA|nr:hypothetical protein TIFTF001_017396 [Ficus carica]